MGSLTFQIEVSSSHPPDVIFDKILDLENWQSFTGFGPIPGIEQATFENPDSPVPGRRIRVKNLDGSQHVEKVTHWNAPNSITMELKEFSAPLSTLASHFIERWKIEAQSHQILIVRSFELFPKNSLVYPLLWIISRFLKLAVARHTRQLASNAGMEYN